MKSLTPILLLSLSLLLLSCGGPEGEKTESPQPEAVETENTAPSRAEAGEHPGQFTLEDAEITLLGRAPREGAQVLTFVYYRPGSSVIRTYDILTDLDPGLGPTGGEPAMHTTWKDIDTYNSEERGGEIFEILYPEMTGDCVLTATTATGPVTIELGDAGKIYRYAEKVRPGKKAYVTPWLGRHPVFMEELELGRYPMILDELEEGDIVFPTGELKTATVKDVDGNIKGEPVLFKEVDTLEDESDWVIADDEVFEYAGYMEKPGDK